MTGLISVIVTTYNWPQALAACLRSLLAQTDRNFEIIVADDGSGQATGQLIAEFMSAGNITMRHMFHEDQGFRAGAIRNKAAAVATGDYLLFVDGDCVVFPHFIARHRQLAEAGHFVPGNRILLNRIYTTQVLEQQIALHRASIAYFIAQRLKGNINRLLPLAYLPAAGLRHLHPRRWQKAMTCNLGVWKQDFLAINGFDEQFQGWGFEDSDLVIRLIHHGVKRKEGRFAVPVLHLWHPQNDRSRHDRNYHRLKERLADKAFVRCECGVDRYL
ncbi:MAG: glycosyltransferase family 2 protein [Methylococcales bacterium]|nr:glycosyltransferase family 2 protein [Methylococcales bacterium]